MKYERLNNQLTNSFTLNEKKKISFYIKPITLDEINIDMDKLIEMSSEKYIKTIPARSMVGNKVVDFFSFYERLNTKGKYNASYFDFVENYECFREKHFIKNMERYYCNIKNYSNFLKENSEEDYKILKNIYSICISAINIMKPLNCVEIFKKYKSKRVLNFCAGWGGTMVGSAALNLEHHYGVEINTNLREPYEQMICYLKKKSKTQFDIWFENSANFNYLNLNYDTVFTSPPYYFIEKYSNNPIYSSKTEMEQEFYIPSFKKSYEGLSPGGYYIINVCEEVYNKVLIKLFGEAQEKFYLNKSKRQNNYTEKVYVWKKCN